MAGLLKPKTLDVLQLPARGLDLIVERRIKLSIRLGATKLHFDWQDLRFHQRVLLAWYLLLNLEVFEELATLIIEKVVCGLQKLLI